MDKNKELQKQQIQKKAILKIQRSCKKYLAWKKFRKAVKLIKKKNFTANQLLISQRTYCDHLKFIIKQVLEPSKKAINDQQLHQILFCNITEIFMMHYVFLYKLEQLMKEYKTHITQLSKPLRELFTHQKFQITYTDYCYNYSKADKIIKLLTQNNSSFKEVLKKAGIINSAMNLQSYMIKPVQRLCKYEVILRQYFKNMSQYHQDYQQIKEVIQIIQNLVNSTNQQVEEYLYIQRYKQLKYEYPDIFAKHQENPQKPRKLVYQLNPTNVYLLNLIKQEQFSIESITVFNDILLLIPSKNIGKPMIVNILHIRKVEDMKYFKNLLQIIDPKKYYTLEFKSSNERDSLIQNIQTKTNYFSEKSSFFTVQVLGTQRRESFFKYYTVYIVQINQNSKITKIYPRFKNLLKIQDILLKKNQFLQIHVPALQKQSLHQTLKSKTIQRRKLHIRQFLQRIINNKKIMQNDQIRQTLDYYQGKVKKKQKSKQDDEILVLLPNWQHIKIHLNAKFSKIKDLKAKIAMQLQFIHSSQFEIFQIRNKNYSSKRLMYDDESVVDIFNNQESLNLNPFADKLEYMFSRHYYLSSEQELSLYKLDFIRLQLQLSVIKTEILTYGLEQQLMITFMCLFAMYINLPLEDDKIVNFIKDVDKKSYKVSLPQFRIYYSQVQKIVQSQQDEAVTVPFLIIKILSNNRLYQCQQFQVEVHKKCIQAIRKEILGIQQRVVLGIRLSHLMVLTVKQKHLIKSIEYKDIDSLQMYPNGIVIHITSMTSIFRIKTTQGYEINKLITIYKQKKGMGDSPDMASILA